MRACPRHLITAQECPASKVALAIISNVYKKSRGKALRLFVSKGRR